MPLLDNAYIDQMVALAHLHRECGECGHHTAQDYCRSCDEFYWIHAPGCAMFTAKHYGHRLYLVPFVEDRGTQQPYIVCPQCGLTSHNPNDVEQRYCGNCHAFHDDLWKRMYERA